MTLSKGDHLRKVRKEKELDEPVTGEAHYRFEVIDLTPTFTEYVNPQPREPRPEDFASFQWVKLRVLK